jgi:hypothetical protein
MPATHVQEQQELADQALAQQALAQQAQALLAATEQAAPGAGAVAVTATEQGYTNMLALLHTQNQALANAAHAMVALTQAVHSGNQLAANVGTRAANDMTGGSPSTHVNQALAQSPVVQISDSRTNPVLSVLPAAKAKQPKEINERFLRDILGQAGAEGCLIQLKYLLKYNQHLPDYPQNVQPFVVDMTAAVFVQSALLALEKELRARPDLQIRDGSGLCPAEHVFIASFLQWATGEVRPPAVIALEELHSGAVRQGNDAAAQYAQKFFQRSRVLPAESQASLCTFFLRGLKPDLQSRCLMDRNNVRWSNLLSLVQFTYAEEERMNTSLVCSPAPPRQESQKRHWQSSGGEPAKRFKGSGGSVAAMHGEDDMETEGTVAAAAGGGNGRPGYGPPAVPFVPPPHRPEDTFYGDGTARPLIIPGSMRNERLQDCLLYGTADGPRLLRLEDASARQYDSLVMFNLCKACRVSNTHQAKSWECPKHREHKAYLERGQGQSRPKAGRGQGNRSYGNQDGNSRY